MTTPHSITDHIAASLVHGATAASVRLGTVAAPGDDEYARAREEFDFARAHNVRMLWSGDLDAYPRRLLSSPDAPAMLYALGGCNLDAAHTVAIVGTRRSTAYGNEMARRIVESLAAHCGRDVVIVSGLAYGIDIAAHKAALDAVLPTVGVVAHPLNTLYPAEHREWASKMIEAGGAVVSEYPTVTTEYQGRNTFLARNRIIAALSDITIVIESDVRGGSLSTARHARRYGRPVYAVPGRITDRGSAGCNALIANGNATAIADVDAFVAALGWGSATPGKYVQRELTLDIDPEHARMLDIINQHPAYTVNDLCAATSKTYADVVNTLFGMEMAGLITALPGGRYQPL